MSFRRTFAIVLRQYYLLRGSLSRIIPIFSWVVVDMVLWGFLTRYLNTVAVPGFNFVPALLGAVLLWDFFIRIMQGTTMAFLEDVWSRNFLNIFATPLLIPEYVGGLILSSIATSLAALGVMLAIAAAFKFSLLTYGFMALPFLFVLFLFGISLGIFGSALVLRLGPAAEWFIWPLPALISPFVGVLYPVSTLPHWMQGISRVLPPSYVFEGLRAIVSGGTASGMALVTGGCLAVGYIFLAYWTFTRVYKSALRTGLIARYSAENLG
jgi:ABC-2 type transport system permease protein